MGRLWFEDDEPLEERNEDEELENDRRAIVATIVFVFIVIVIAVVQSGH